MSNITSFVPSVVKSQASRVTSGMSATRASDVRVRNKRSDSFRKYREDLRSKMPNNDLK